MTFCFCPNSFYLNSVQAFGSEPESERSSDKGRVYLNGAPDAALLHSVRLLSFCLNFVQMNSVQIRFRFRSKASGASALHRE